MYYYFKIYKCEIAYDGTCNSFVVGNTFSFIKILKSSKMRTFYYVKLTIYNSTVYFIAEIRNPFVFLYLNGLELYKNAQIQTVSLYDEITTVDKFF